MRALLLVFLAGCAHTSPAAHAPPPHVAGQICGIELDDKCHALVDPLDQRDVDGCPDMRLVFDGNRVEPRDSQALSHVAEEMQQIPQLTRVHVHVIGLHGTPQSVLDSRVAYVQTNLSAHRVALERVTVKLDAPDEKSASIWFEPAECDGKRISAK